MIGFGGKLIIQPSARKTPGYRSERAHKWFLLLRRLLPLAALMGETAKPFSVFKSMKTICYPLHPAVNGGGLHHGAGNLL